MKKIILALCATGAVALASPANAAITVDGTALSAGQSTTLTFNGATGDGTPVAGLGSTLGLTLMSESATSYTFSYTLSILSAASADLSGFGFMSAPEIQSTSRTGDLNVALNTLFPDNGGQSVDFCAYSGANCTAGSGHADSFTGTFTLNYAAGTGDIALTDFVTRYTGIVAANGVSGIGHTTGAVPEPATWAMMLLGFGAIGATMRRRKPVLAQVA